MNESGTGAKEAAEIALIRAQTAKLEQEGNGQPVLGRLTEFLKVAGALILGAGGVTAAITGYQMNEVKNERLVLAAEKKQLELSTIEAELAERQAQYTKLGDDLDKLNESLKSRQSDYDKLVDTVNQLQEQLVLARNEVPRSGSPGAASARIDAAIRNAGEARAAVETRSREFKTLRSEVDRLSKTQHNLATKLNAAPLQAPK